MHEKTERYVASLTDAEIERQLAHFFDWANAYKALLEAEQARRRDDFHPTEVFSWHDADAACESEDADDFDGFAVPEEGDAAEITLNYALAQMIRQKVAAFSAETTKEQLEKLRQVPTQSLSAEDLAELQYEIETCELHLFELTGETLEESRVCPSCGAELEEHARFCGKCGARLDAANG